MTSRAVCPGSVQLQAGVHAPFIPSLSKDSLKASSWVSNRDVAMASRSQQDSGGLTPPCCPLPARHWPTPSISTNVLILPASPQER